MAMKCLACGYKMKTWQEVTQVATEALLRYLGVSSTSDKVDKALRQGAVAGPANQLKIKCPSCSATGRWEDG